MIIGASAERRWFRIHRAEAGNMTAHCVPMPPQAVPFHTLAAYPKIASAIFM